MKPTIAFRVIQIGATFGAMTLACLPSLSARAKQLKGTAEIVLHNKTQTLSVSASRDLAIFTDIEAAKPVLLIRGKKGEPAVRVEPGRITAVSVKQVGIEAAKVMEGAEGHRLWKVSIHYPNKTPKAEPVWEMWE